MNLNKLRQDLLDKKFTDVNLILYDSEGSIGLHAHRVVLAISCDYFHQLFTFGSEKNEFDITIKIPDNKAIHDIIMSFLW